MMFYKNDKQDIPSHHNRPLYVTASDWNIVRCVMVDPVSSLNTISLSILAALGVPPDRMTKQPIEVSSFEGKLTYTLGF